MTDTSTRVFTPPNTLARSLTGPGRMGFNELVQRAQVKVASVSDQLEAFILEKSLSLLNLLQQSADGVYRDRNEILGAAADIAATAAPGRCGEVGEAARAVYLLIQGMEEQGIWREDVLAVHATSLSLILRAPETKGFSRVLDDLMAARAAIGITG